MFNEGYIVDRHEVTNIMEEFVFKLFDNSYATKMDQYMNRIFSEYIMSKTHISIDLPHVDQTANHQKLFRWFMGDVVGFSNTELLDKDYTENYEEDRHQLDKLQSMYKYPVDSGIKDGRNLFGSRLLLY